MPYRQVVITHNIVVLTYRGVNLNAIIQLGFDSRDDKLFWVDQWLWDDDTVSSVQRPTEITAFRNMFRQARLLQKRGLFINLSALHLEAMRLEYRAMTTPPMPANVYQWVSAKMHGVPPTQVKSLLEECSLVTLLRDAMGMRPITIDWDYTPAQKGKRAA
jgi:hypothetical protein